MKTALITGVTGQDGSFLAEFLISKGYEVWGMIRRASSFNTSRIDHLIEHNYPRRFGWDRGDMTDMSSLIRILAKVRPDEVYHLAAQSHVMVSFELPTYTTDVVATGTLRLLEAIRSLNSRPKIYNAASSEMFGLAPPPQSESTPFSPQSPYAVAKVAAYNLCLNYRKAFGLWVANGILFNHESPRRGETFVTRKITRAVARIALGIQKEVVLGNLEARRDWGYAPEYVKMMWRILQQNQPRDYVISTGKSHSVFEFVNEAFSQIGVELSWAGGGLQKKARILRISDSKFKKSMRVGKGDVVVRLSRYFLRPSDPEELVGDSTRARKELGWHQKVEFKELVRIMTRTDIKRALILLEGTRKHNEEWREYLL